jgi:Phage tail lysozyme
VTAHVTAPMLAAYNHFLAVGFTENGAAAPVGNGVQESGEFLVATMFRAHPDWSGGVADPLKSGGFEEWLGERKTALIAFIGRAEARLGLSKGSLLNDLGTQCDFVVYELQTNPSYATLYQQLTTGTRSIANLTANFCWVYERPAAATANVENRIAHAEAVVVRAKELKAAQAPVVPTTAGQMPEPRPPLPTTSTQTPPPISASTAGRRAAFRDSIGAARDVLEKEREDFNKEIAAEIAALDKLGEEFGNADPRATLSLHGQQQTTPSTELINPQRTHTMLGPNWQTSLAGIGAIFGAAAGIIHSVSINQMPDMTQMGVIFAAVSAGFGLIQAKDKAVTGGTVPATPEAKRRVGA